MRISIVVPVYNEAPLIRPFLEHLRQQAPGAEIIVADGGSTDGTAELAARSCDQLVQSQRGRARQMNTGAHAAHGEILWFLHADVEVPVQCLHEIRAHYARFGRCRRLLPDSFARTLGVSANRQFRALRGHSAANTMW